MGLGDAIMATSQVKALHESNGKPVYVVGRNGAPQWSEIFEHNPRITREPYYSAQVLLNGPGLRPYIASKTRWTWTWQKWDIRPGEIFLTEQEKAFAAPYAGRILIEPHTKVQDGNKAWIAKRWQQVVDTFSHRFVQTGPPGTQWLDGVDYVTTTFRQACAVLAVSKAYVGPEGGTHHAAAALNVPAVVLYSEFIDPSITGYPMHRNLRHANGTCGSRIPCSSCRDSMERITVDEVTRNLGELI